MAMVYRAADIDVISQEDVTGVVENTLAVIGLTFDELAEQARTRHFHSIQARLAWLAIGELYHG